MKPNSVLRVFFAIAIPATACAQASLPTGANVVAGSASFSTAGNSMTVNTGSQRTIINYNTFNVGAGNSVLFNQPSSSSATLNRVLGADVSTIYGSVTSNGQIFLVNPSGIFVGPGGSFSGSSVYLSTGNISNADFLGGNIRFDPPPAGSTILIDGGRIDATDLIRFEAPQISVTGSVNSSSIVFHTTLTGPPSPISVMSSPPLVPEFATIVVSGSGSSGNLSFSSGNLVLTGGTGISPGTSLGGTITISGTGTISLMGSDASLGLTGGYSSSPLVISGRAPPLVVSGSASFTSTSNFLTVTNKSGTISNWNDFSIGASEITRFAQPSASTAVLNRVLGNPPLITGQLVSNGTVVLVGPGGALAAPGGVVPTAGPNLAPAPLPPPAARPQAPSIPSGTSGLVDGTVTVRLSLVDAAPISLR